VTDVDDEQVLRQAVALDGIHFDLLSSEQSVRLALALERAADELRVEFRGSSDPRDRELADRLDDLRLRLSDITGS
jgi:hypothetical protein